jgi:hypothetical protein
MREHTQTKNTHKRSPTIANDHTSDFLLNILFAIDSGAIQHTGPTPLIVYTYIKSIHSHYQCWIFKSNKTHFIHFCFNWHKINKCVLCWEDVWNVLCCVVLLPFLHLFSQEFVTFQNPKYVFNITHNKWECVNMRENELKRREREETTQKTNEKNSMWERETQGINQNTEILGFPLPVSKVFLAARSQWTILCLWRWYIPNAIPRINSSFRSFDSFSFESYNNLSKLPVLCCVVLCCVIIHSQIERDREKVLYIHTYISHIQWEEHISLSLFQWVWKQERFREWLCVRFVVCIWERGREREYQK